MADPRFYDNRGPFRLADLCVRAGLDAPVHADGAALVFDVAGIAQGGPQHLSFFEGKREKARFQTTKAGWCLVRKGAALASAPPSTVLLASPFVARAFGAIAGAFYPDHELCISAQDAAVHERAKLGRGVVLAPGVVVGPNAEIGDRTRVGACTVIGKGVAIGRDCEIGSHASISFAYLGDRVVIQPGVKIGGSGFGFASGADGHVKMPQLGRVIIQDAVEVGANSTIDRAALADTVIGEGTKIDNLVQIGHNTVTGRHCVIAGQAGISGSVVLGDFVIVGGMAGIADHVTIGDRARLAGLTGVARDIEAGRDYGGIPARPVRDWHREMVALAKLARKDQRTIDE